MRPTFFTQLLVKQHHYCSTRMTLALNSLWRLMCYCNILICRCMQKHIQYNKDERTQFFRKIYLSLYSKGFERVTKGIVCERWVGDWTELQHIDPPTLLATAAFLSHSPGLLNRGPGGPSLCWDMVLIPVSSLQLIWTSCGRGYIIIWRKPTSCKRHNSHSIQPFDSQGCPPWYLRPDAPVIYTGAFLLLTAWPGSICYTIEQRNQTKPIYFFTPVITISLSRKCCPWNLSFLKMSWSKHSSLDELTAALPSQLGL